MGRNPPPNLPFTLGDVDPHLIQQSLGTTLLTTQMAAQSLHTLLHNYAAKSPLLQWDVPHSPPKLPLAVGWSPPIYLPHPWTHHTEGFVTMVSVIYKTYLQNLSTTWDILWSVRKPVQRLMLRFCRSGVHFTNSVCQNKVTRIWWSNSKCRLTNHHHGATSIDTSCWVSV